MKKGLFFQEVLATLPLPVLFLRRDGDDFAVSYMNSAAEEVIALSLEQLSGKPLRDGFPQVPEQAHQELEKIFSKDLSARANDVRYENRLGQYYILRITLSRLGEGILITGESLLARSEPIQVYHPSSYDGLTGILLRDQFFYYGERELLSCRSRQVDSATLMIDLDRFKAINDEKGHAAGDRVLSRVSETLSGLVRYNDILGRYGGDEMALLVPGASEEIAEEIAHRICRSLRDPTASVGVALSPHSDNSSFSDLIGFADQSMYEAKEAGGDQYKIKNL